MRKNKGLQRSQKEWEESFASHIGKFVDRLKTDDIFSLLTYGFAGWMGAQAFQKYPLKEPYRSIGGFATGIVAMKMALAPSTGLIPITNTVGLLALAAMGVIAMPGGITVPENISGLLGGYGLKEALETPVDLGVSVAATTPSTALLGIGGIPEKEPYPGYYPWWHV